MEFNTCPLEEPLIDHIESIFHYKGFMPDHSIERVVPTGHVFIIFELDGLSRNTYDNQSLEVKKTYNNVWVSGMHKKYLSISAHPDSEMLVIQFKTKGAYPFFPCSIHALNDQVVAAEKVFGENILVLREQILQENLVASKFKLIKDWLLVCFNDKQLPSLELCSILDQLKAKSFLDSNAIISSYSKTQKHLINQCKTYFGLTPKVLHRIFRFNNLLSEIQHQNNLEWSKIAYEFGYSDQSHFIKEFKEFSGFNPQEFIKSSFHEGETNFFPLDRKG